MDTIYALSSAPGKAGVAVLRISGARAAFMLETLAHRPLPPPRRAQLAAIHHPASRAVIDHALVLYFPAPASFTGEDVVELHVHGGRAVIDTTLHALSCLGGRMAEAGEFTRRALANEKLDLAQTEGLADLLDAETEAQREQALAQMAGALSQRILAWRDQLLRILAHAEADIDFPEEDLPPALVARRIGELQNLAQEFVALLNDKRKGEILRDGFSIAILGAPNTGKSSLLNALAQRDAAIVSARAGTTRDVIEVHLTIAGYPVTIADTAGLRDSADEIENEGMARALQRASEANLKIILFDATVLPQLDARSLGIADDTSLMVFNKMDLASSATAPSLIPDPVYMSLTKNHGITELLALLEQRLKEWMASGARGAPLTRPRQREALMHAHQHLITAITAYQQKKPSELIAEDLRLALRALGRITGQVDIDEVLDVIFRDFCIGK
jgi:tRNA modification GTPase